MINDDRIDAHINKDLEIIVEEILKEIEYVDCILLGGGFGRGEGSVIITESKIQPVNDYDIYVITEHRPNFNTINSIRSKLISLIKIRQIDIDFKTMVGSQTVPYIYEDYVDNKKVASGIMKLYRMKPEKRAKLSRRVLKYVSEEFAYQKTIDLWHDTMIDTLEKFKAGRKSWEKIEF